MSTDISNGYDKRCLEVIWDALHEWRYYNDKEEDRWDNICTAMAWIQEDLEEITQDNKEQSKC